MTDSNQLTVKAVNIHQSKIDVVKFDGTNNFGMWRCEMTDALTAIDLSIENCLHFKRRLYHFHLTIGKHMNNYTKLLVDLTNVDEVIKDEDKTLILLSYFSDDNYETFVLILINSK